MSGRFGKVALASAAFAGALWLAGDSFSAAPKKAAGGGKGASGELETAAPMDAVIGIIKELTKKADGDISDEEFGDAGVKFAVIAELANLQSLREDPEIKAWAAAMVKAYAKGAVKEPNKGDAQEVIKESKALLAQADKNLKKWAAAKPGAGTYKSQQPNLELLMAYVGAAHAQVRKTLGQPGMNFQKAYVGTSYALAEIGNVTTLFSPNKDWKDWSVVHKKSYVDVATKLAKGEVNEARKSFEAAQANCKACHDKYQQDAPVGFKHLRDGAAVAGR